MHLHARGIATGASMAEGAKSQAYTESATTTSQFHKTTREQPGTCEEWIYESKMRCNTIANTRVQAAAELRPLFTCITFIGVKHQRGPLRAGAGVSTGPEETQMTTHILTRVGY